MLHFGDNVYQSVDALRVHKLRAILTIVGLTMGVATLITVMTIVQGANLYVEQKIANLGTNVFQIARTPFAATDFNLIIKALKHKIVEESDYRALAELCTHCKEVGATASATVKLRNGDKETSDTSLNGQTPTMVDIDTRTVQSGRYFTDTEDQHAAMVCLLGDTPIQQLFGGADPIGQTVRTSGGEFLVIGTYEKLGSVLGQDQDNYLVVPMTTFLKLQGTHNSLTLNVLTGDKKGDFDRAMDQAHQIMRARRHITGNAEEDFYIGTKDSYMSLWASISGAFFAVFVMVSSISAVVGGIVIMNVMLVSVTERTKEIGIRRALGATQQDILKQFLTESVMQCVIGGLIGISGGFLCALALRTFTSFPAAVQMWVAILGVFLSSGIGLFFGIYPAMRASRLDPVVALRAD